MNVRKLGWLVSAASVVVFVCLGALLMQIGLRAAAPEPTASQTSVRATRADDHQLSGAKGHLLDRKSVYAFLTAAKQAEAIADPMQRCLAYPNPPDSHWSAAAVRAYCRYRTYPVMSYDEVRGLLQQGQFAELDRRLAVMLQDKLTKPDAAGVMDRAYDTWFNRGDLELRPLLENWKRASPHSAFAYTASGISYLAMGMKARGNAYMADTPASNVEAMDRWVERAGEDLRHAVQLDARLTPAYAAMVHASRYGLGDAWLQRATQEGLRIDPANFDIYNELMFVLQPKWGGSLADMTRTAREAGQHASENPLLLLLAEKELAYEAKIDDDDCNVPGKFELYSVVFDQVAVSQQLLNAGYQAESCGHLELSIVYFSEALRFYPEEDDVRLHRSYNLNEFDESAWATDEANRLLSQEPRNVRYLVARGYGYESQNDYPHAEKDFVAALDISPDDNEAIGKLANLYMNDTHEWDKAWALDDHVIQAFPSSPYGWWMRAQIQQRQPRKGLKETADYFQAHFDTNPDTHKELLRMRAAQALQESAAHAPAKASAG